MPTGRGKFSQRVKMNYLQIIENLEEGSFSDKQMDQLKKEYSKIPKLTYEQGEKLKKKVESFPTAVLKQLADADIPWLTMFAKLKLNKK